MTTPAYFDEGAARAAIARLKLVPIPITPLPDVTERGDTGWQDWDDAMLQLDFARQSERLAWTR